MTATKESLEQSTVSPDKTEMKEAVTTLDVSSAELSTRTTPFTNETAVTKASLSIRTPQSISSELGSGDITEEPKVESDFTVAESSGDHTIDFTSESPVTEAPLVSSAVKTDRTITPSSLGLITSFTSLESTMEPDTTQYKETVSTVHPSVGPSLALKTTISPFTEEGSGDETTGMFTDRSAVTKLHDLSGATHTIETSTDKSVITEKTTAAIDVTEGSGDETTGMFTDRSAVTKPHDLSGTTHTGESSTDRSIITEMPTAESDVTEKIEATAGVIYSTTPYTDTEGSGEDITMTATKESLEEITVSPDKTEMKEAVTTLDNLL
ncbi:uncharacterized protein LOC118237147 [Anguilla anguilla]|uniref:uncharacterized protein LOC118237147 n=1 Tax=Anguilla anguilla TaxID=7936 RepID=UPI0015AF3954|nr:uncharacterized protein LOC118237147 [Anguilla anguilla]